jgi:biopolymer transport protein ExbB
MRQRLLNGPWAGVLFSLSILVLAVGAFSLTSLLPAPTAVAADEEPAPADEDPAEDIFADEGAAAPAAPAGAGEDEAIEAPEEMSYLGWIYRALGPMYMVIFLALSFTLVALFVMNLLTARRDNVCPMHLVETFEGHLNEKRYQDAYELAKADESFLGQVLSAGLAKLSAGYSPAIEAMQEVGEEENMKLEHRLSYMALIGTISPMVGLFGTVHGMIASFQVIAAGGSTPKASDLAAGISTALFTTLIGLAIAIPAIAAFNILKNRVARLVLEVGILSESLMSRFENVGGQK